MIVHSRANNCFYYRSTLEEWQEVRDWLKEKTIVWHALGGNIISFDTEEDAILFALKWS